MLYYNTLHGNTDRIKNNKHYHVTRTWQHSGPAASRLATADTRRCDTRHATRDRRQGDAAAGAVALCGADKRDVNSIQLEDIMNVYSLGVASGRGGGVATPVAPKHHHS